MLKSGSVLKRDESGLRNVPGIVVWTMPLFVILMVGCGVAFVITLLTSRTFGIVQTILFIVAVLSWAWGEFVDKFYNFQENLRYEVKNKSLVCRYELAGSVIPTSNKTVTIKIKDVTKIKRKKNGFKVVGDLTESRPFSKEKQERREFLQTKGFSKTDVDDLYNFLKEMC